MGRGDKYITHESPVAHEYKLDMYDSLLPYIAPLILLAEQLLNLTKAVLRLIIPV